MHITADLSREKFNLHLTQWREGRLVSLKLVTSCIRWLRLGQLLQQQREQWGERAVFYLSNALFITSLLL